MKHTLVIIFAIITVFIFGGNSSYAAQHKPDIIRIGSAYSAGYGKPYSTGILGIVHARGLLEEEFKNDGIKLNWYFFKGAGRQQMNHLQITQLISHSLEIFLQLSVKLVD